MYKIIYLEDAILDLGNIYDYISLDSKLHGIKVIFKIKDTIKNLEFFPFLGKSIGNDFRVLIDSKYKYKIVYQIRDKEIFIVSIFKYENKF